MNEKYIKPSSHQKTRVASVRITESQKKEIDRLNFNLSAFVRDKLDELFSDQSILQENTDVIRCDTTLLHGYKYAEIKQILLLLYEIDKLLKSAQAHFGHELIYNLFTIIDFLELNKTDLSTLIEHDSEIDAITREIFDFLTHRHFSDAELSSFFKPMPS